MKMTKKLVQRAVLLLAFVLLLTLVAATAVLAGEADPMMTVTFNSEECNVTLNYTGLAEPIKMVSGMPVEIPYSSAVTVTVEPLLGYQLSDIVDADNPGTSIKSLYAPTYYNQYFLGSVHAEVICSTRVFGVKFEQANVTDLPYQFPEFDNPADLTALQYHYKQPNNKTLLPTVVRPGHTFQYWQVIKSNGEEVQKITADPQDGKYYIPSDIINQDMVDNGTIYLHAEFTANLQKVTRYDYVYNTAFGVNDKLLGSYEWESEMDAWISGLTQMGDDAASDDPSNPYLNYKSYPGYRLFLEGNYPRKQVTMPTPQNPNPNVFNRLYVPVVYTLVYENLEDGTLPADAPMTYTYDQHTQILQPTRRGYTFTGWIVEVDGVQVIDRDHAVMDFVLGNQGTGNAEFAAKDEQITLIATWQANSYGITYDWNVPEELIADMDAWNADLPKTFTFNTPDFFINNPFRKGYSFTGWTLTCACTDHESGSVSGLNPGDGKTQLDCTAHAGNITLIAHWEAENYTVVLDGQGVSEGFTTQIEGVKYGQALVIPNGFILPQKVGHTFGGYWSAPNGGGTQYIDKDGNSVCESWDIDAENEGTITLYAYWTVNYYNIIIPTIDKIPTDPQIVVVVIKDGIEERKSYVEGFKLPYGTEFRVEIEMPDGFKIVKWNDRDVKLDDNEAGVGENRQNGKFFSSAHHTVGAAEEGLTLIAIACPSAPVIDRDISINSTDSGTGIVITVLNPNDAQKYEFAIPDENGQLVWYKITDGSNQYIFEGLNPSTYYSVYVRLEKTGDALEGVPLVKETNTRFDKQVDDAIETLKGMLKENENETTVAWKIIYNIIEIIETEEGKITELPPEGFYDWINDRIAEAEEKLVFARFQDSKIIALQMYLKECIESNSFKDVNESLLYSECANAEAKIFAATTEEAVNEIFNIAMAAMKAVPATYLSTQNKELTLESSHGMSFGGSLQLDSIQDIHTLRRAIADAIAKGNITAHSAITIDEATALLRALDTISAYQFSIIDVQVSEDDVFTITLKLHESMLERTGLQVAYFNQTTGMVELLKTTQVGTTLIFEATYIADFVILADPTVNLEAVIIALGVILLCQLIAIAFVLVARSKAKKSVMHASVALPMFLTIHFLPNFQHAELIALGLGVAVLLAQIVLMWLLLSSGMIRVFNFKRRRALKPEDTAVVHENDLQGNHQVLVKEQPTEKAIEDVVNAVVNEVISEVVDEVIDELAEELVDEPAQEFIEEATNQAPAEEGSETEAFDEEAFDQELAEELASEQAQEYAEKYVNEANVEEAYEEVVEEVLPEETEEVYEDEEFIAEEAHGSYYSTDDEENVYAYNQEETERVSDAPETNQEIEETSYDSDPLAGVFGESDEQHGTSSNEGG